MSEKSVGNSSGHFFTLLAILFIGLKLGGLIDWSWWWVLCPIWGPAIFAFLAVSVFLIVVGYHKAKSSHN